MEQTEAVDTEYLTEKEAAQVLTLSVGTLQNKRVQGGGPAFLKFGACVRYSRRDLDAWALSRRRTRTSDCGEVAR
jgi:hypothetical protein